MAPESERAKADLSALCSPGMTRLRTRQTENRTATGGRRTACENCGRDFTNWWNWIRFWNRPVTRFCAGVYCFGCAEPKVLFGEAWKKTKQKDGYEDDFDPETYDCETGKGNGSQYGD